LPLAWNTVAALPFGQQERAGANRVVAGLAGVRCNHFLRHHARGRHRQVKREIDIGTGQADAQRVAVQRLQAGDGRGVAEVILEC
jgi:hypothetical protein